MTGTRDLKALLFCRNLLDPLMDVGLYFTESSLREMSCRHRKRAFNGCVLIAFDCMVLLIALTLGLLCAWILKEGVLGQEYAVVQHPEQLRQRYMFFLALIALYVLASGLRGHYYERAPYWDEVRSTVQLVAWFVLIDAFAHYSVKHDFSRLWLLLTWGLAMVCLVGGRTLAIRWLDHLGCWKLRTSLICGPAERSRTLSALGSDQRLGFDVQDVLTTDEFVDQGEVRMRGRTSAGNVDFLILVPGEHLEQRAFEKMLRTAISSRVPYAVIPGVKGLATYELIPQYFYSDDIVLMHSRQNLARPGILAAKRAVDFVISVFLLILAAPILAILMILTALDGGPAIYRHQRIGRGGKAFTCLKLRTMACNSDHLLDQYLDSCPEAKKSWEVNQKLEHDPRVTRLGALLRKTSFDELPQLINVLKGEMSLVGPRPIIEDEVSMYEEWFELYQEVRPGITGLWQVSGRNSISYQERVALDRWYVTNWSLWLDVTIMLRTVPTMLLHRNGL